MVRLVESIENGPEALVRLSVPDGQAPGSLPEGCYVEFSDVQGCDGISTHQEPSPCGEHVTAWKISAKSDDPVNSIRIGDTSNFPPYVSGGLVTEKKVGVPYPFKSLSETLKDPGMPFDSMVGTDMINFGSELQTHVLLYAALTVEVPPLGLESAQIRIATSTLRCLPRIMASDPPPMPFFVREKEFLKLYGFGTSQIEEAQAPPFPLALPKAASWCPSGIALAMVDPVQGPRVAVFESETGSKLSGASLLDLPKAPKNAFTFMWSPMGSALVTIAPGGKNLQEGLRIAESNVHVWHRAGADGPGAGAGQGGEYELQASYCHPKLEKDKKVLQWTNDENLCARLTPEGKIILYDGANLGEDHLMELAVQNVAGFEFAPMTASETCFARLALFVADQRDDLQRVVGPAEAVADLLWNNMGSCLIAHCQTEVDETGQSYYGGSRLALMSRAGEVKKDLTDEECQGGCVQAVSWSPTRDEFILISGFQPAKATLYVWDEKAKKVSSKKTLLDKAHRNTIRYNSFGSLVCLAGFGNLAGGVDFFGRDEDEYVHVASCTANCTVSAEWAPDGRHFLTAVLAPRMRVDNAINIWSGLSGSKVCTTPFEARRGFRRAEEDGVVSRPKARRVD
eukprot:s504_g11.t1